MSDLPILVVDDDADVRQSLRSLLESHGHKVLDFPDAESLLGLENIRGACLVCDIRLPGIGGLALQEELVGRGLHLPLIFITGHGEVALAVRAMKAGAVDFIEKPFDSDVLLESIRRAIEIGGQERNVSEEATAAKKLVSLLTPRERQVLEQLVAGRSNKLAAYELSISPRTVEIHRARIMEKLQARSLSDVVRVALANADGAHLCRCRQ